MGRKGFDSAVFLSKVGAGKTIVDCQKDQILFAQDDPVDAVFYIESGNLKMTLVSEHGKEAVVALLEIGRFFGEGCLDGQPRPPRLTLRSSSATHHGSTRAVCRERFAAHDVCRTGGRS